MNGTHAARGVDLGTGSVGKLLCRLALLDPCRRQGAPLSGWSGLARSS